MSARLRRAAALGAEAAADLLASPSRTGLLMVLVVLTVGSAVGVETASASASRDRFRAWLRDGGSAYVVRLRSPVPGSACDRLAGHTPVVRSGALGPSRLVRPRPWAPTEILEYRVSPGLVGFLDPSGAAPGPPGRSVVLVGATAQEISGLTPGAPVAAGAEDATVVGLPVSGRTRSFGRSWLVPDATVWSDQCHVEIDARAWATPSSVVEALAPPGAEVAEVVAYTNRPSDGPPGTTDTTRPWWWMPGAAVILTVQVLAVRQRRRDLALYRALGLSAPATGTVTGAQAVATTALAGIVGALWGLAVAGSLGADVTRGDVLNAGVAIAAVTAASAMVTPVAALMVRGTGVASFLKRD